jgi:hypothetical protein
MREEFNPLNKFCAIWTVHAAETKSIWIVANTLVPCFLLAILTILLRLKTHCRHPDMLQLRHIILTKNISPLAGTGKKSGTSTRTPTNYTAGLLGASHRLPNSQFS